MRVIGGLRRRRRGAAEAESLSLAKTKTAKTAKSKTEMRLEKARREKKDNLEKVRSKETAHRGERGSVRGDLQRGSS